MSSEKKLKLSTVGCIWFTDIFNSNSSQDQDGGGRALVHQAAGDPGQGECEAHCVGLPRQHGQGDHHQTCPDCHVR